MSVERLCETTSKLDVLCLVFSYWDVCGSANVRKRISIKVSVVHTCTEEYLRLAIQDMKISLA